MISEAERFDVTHPALCPHLRWKSYFIQADRRSNSATCQLRPLLVRLYPQLSGTGSRSGGTRQLQIS